MKENIPGLPCYFVSKQGQVFRKDEYIDRRSGKVFQKRNGDWKELKISIHTNRKGKYPCPKVHVCVKDINRSLKVSRLVALAYIPNPENKPCVCHKDNNPLNNHVDNLYWGTQAENMQQCIRDGRYSYNRTFGKIGQNSPTSKYSNRLKLRVFRYKRRHPKVLLKELSNKFKMPISVISKIVKGIDPITKPYL